VWIGEEAPEVPVNTKASGKDAPKPVYVGRFEDGTVSRVSSSGHWTVVEDGVTTIDGDYRAIPRSDSEIVLYSTTGRRAEVRVPRGWAGRKLSLTEIEKPASPVAVQPAAGSSSVSIELRPRTAYVLRPGH
jgi:hypothetical protein